MAENGKMTTKGRKSSATYTSMPSGTPTVKSTSGRGKVAPFNAAQGKAKRPID